MDTRQTFRYLAIALAGGLIAAVTYSRMDTGARGNAPNSPPDLNWEASLPEDFNPDNLDFTYAAERTVHGVVHVKTIREREGREIRSPLDYFFGPREEEPEPDIGFGSGVILDADGHIVTNHHVISQADEIEVTLHDQRSFSATVSGSDPNTDIAVLKIDAEGLAYLEFGSSDDLRIGEWVLAVGNPFGLTSSVTAGIISAKERTLGVIREGTMPVESFLQTDAAVNVGNSGGALVNLKGEVVGIPTLIISPTRTHIGTAFAVPSTIVRSVADDIIAYGEVRRGILGVSIRELTEELAEEAGMEIIRGIYVEDVVNGGAADEAGIRGGDVIVKVEGREVDSPGELQQEIGRRQPGDRIGIEIIRNGRGREVNARLLSMDEHEELIRQQEEELLGATLRMAPEELLEEFNLPGGVQVIGLGPGPMQAAGMREGFVIVAINNVHVSEPAHVVSLLEDYTGNVYMEGIYPDGTAVGYTFSI